jgi:hypothetical protein
LEFFFKGGGKQKLNKSLIWEMRKLWNCFHIALSCISQSPGKGSSVISRTMKENVCLKCKD